MKLKLYAAILLLITISCNNKSKNELDSDFKKKALSSYTTPNNLYEDLEDNPIKIKDYIGKKIVLNFWATWCASCIKEMPSMLKSDNNNY